MRLDTDLESIQEVRILLEQAEKAQNSLKSFSQEEINRIVDNMAQEAMKEANRLALMAVEETGFGNAKDKRTKNLFAAKDVYESIKSKKTAGIVSRDDVNKVWEVAEPVGIVAGIVPSTNPTSTVIFKSLIAIKSRNAIVFSPHPSAAQCTKEASDLMQKAASVAGAPDGIISCIKKPSVAAAHELMKHKLTDVILATGGSDMVKAAYSSGKPAFGVGPGNVPVFIHSSANIKRSVQQIIQSKTFDYGTICASEQAIIVEKSIKQKVIRELKNEGAYFLDDYDKQRIENIVLLNGKLNPKIVGKSPADLADMAGIVIPEGTKVLIAEESNIGKTFAFSIEKLAPLLAFYVADNTEEASGICSRLLELGGLGHTVGIHAENESEIERFALNQKAFRIIVNSGTTFGGIGATTGIVPSMTLGCGSLGKNVTSDNIGPEHLINKKRVAFGIREIQEDEVSTEEYPVSNHTKETINISRDEIMDIVKSVLQELKI